MQLAKIFSIILTLVLIAGCGGVHHYRLNEIQSAQISTKLPGDVSITVAAQKVYNSVMGFNEYNLYVKEAVEKQFTADLKKCFKNGVKKENAQTNIVITALDTSIFPIGNLINDVRLFFRVEIFDKEMHKQKTLTIYGFGSSADGNKALGKAVSNSFYQLLPTLEEMFILE